MSAVQVVYKKSHPCYSIGCKGY